MRRRPAQASSLLLICVAAAVLMIGARRHETASAVTAPSSAQTDLAVRSGTFGPGRISRGMQAGSLPADTVPPDGLAITADRHLVVNVALHEVIDYFLLGGLPGERVQHVAALQAYLKRMLPMPAYAEAADIVQRYLRYLQAHDALLAQNHGIRTAADESLPAADLDRIAAWLAQQARLRESLLGVDVARIWYADETQQAQRKLAELRGDAPPAAQDGTPVDSAQQTVDAVHALQLQGSPEAAQRDLIAREHGEAAAQRFDALEAGERAWQQRYADYRRAADAVRSEAGTAQQDRARQLELLRQKAFPADADRMRAEALDRLRFVD